MSSKNSPQRRTVRLYHGPKARLVCETQALEYGPFVPGSPFGDPLGVDDARKVVGICSHAVVGSGPTSVVVGPLDSVPGATVDVLLKTVEEPYVYGPQLFLWAHDLGEVRSTIRSRARSVWCPGEVVVDKAVADIAANLLKASRARDLHGVASALREIKGTECRSVLEAILVILDPDVDQALWAAIRAFLIRVPAQAVSVAQVFTLLVSRTSP